MAKNERLWKVLDGDRSCKGGDAVWTLGEWMPRVEKVKPCRAGYHLARDKDLVFWLGPTIYEAEARGPIIVHDDEKVVAHEARIIRLCEHWNDRTARLFACWCAEQVIYLYEREYPNDSRVRDCIETARKVANGDLPVSTLAAARDAAWDAARDAARNAAWAAAWDAARNAAWAAAWDAARGRQTRALIHLLDTGKLPEDNR